MLLARLREALGREDASGVRELAHKLTGMVAAFSSEVGLVASTLEDRAAQGDLAEARTLVAQLDELATDLLREVAGLSLAALTAIPCKSANRR